MLIGVPKEIKSQENRVGLLPEGVRALTARGHEVWVQHQAGEGIGIRDADYTAAGAVVKILGEDIFANAQLIVKVKEPEAQECAWLKPNQIVFTFLHLASNRELTALLMQSGCSAIAYETITDAQGRLPLLAPMSQVAGRMSIQVAAHYLEEQNGGSGILLGGVPGVAPGHVLVLGAGQAGSQAVMIATGMQAQVTVLDKSLPRLQALNAFHEGKLSIGLATQEAITASIAQADVVIGSVLVPGAQTPHLVRHPMLRTMRKGSVLVDIAIDQGGCFETSKPTTFDAPVYTEEGIIHYCVTNMPGAVPRTSTFALTQATLPFIIALADKGLSALLEDPHFLAGLNVAKGHVTYEAIAHAWAYPYVAAKAALEL